MNHKAMVAITLTLIAGLAVGFALGRLVRTPAPAPITQAPVTSTGTASYYTDTAVAEPCSYFQCLFSAAGEIIGYGELDGYYRAETVTGGGEEDSYAGITQTCDRFVVTGGSAPLVGQFHMMIDSGNTLSRLEDKHLVVNLNLDDANLDPALVARIRASTTTAPISLGVLQTFREGKGAAPCTSIIRVVNENRALTPNVPR